VLQAQLAQLVFRDLPDKEQLERLVSKEQREPPEQLAPPVLQVLQGQAVQPVLLGLKVLLDQVAPVLLGQ
jgi:hypothetical protein